MARIMAIDYGRKRVGIAVTDTEQIIASGLTTVAAHDVFDFIKQYLQNEEVETFVVGEAKNLDNTAAESSRFIEPFVKRLQKLYPAIPVERVDERFTSKMAFQSMIDGGLRKKARRNKALIDEISATIILQSYLANRR
jgi:putative Holliday junction resolvase